MTIKQYTLNRAVTTLLCKFYLFHARSDKGRIQWHLPELNKLMCLASSKRSIERGVLVSSDTVLYYYEQDEKNEMLHTNLWLNYVSIASL